MTEERKNDLLNAAKSNIRAYLMFEGGPFTNPNTLTGLTDALVYITQVQLDRDYETAYRIVNRS